MRQAQAVKKGVAAANGTPREFTTDHRDRRHRHGPPGHEGVAVSRESSPIPSSSPCAGHCYDALVGPRRLRQALPGMMMAMVRLNVPSIFIYGGSDPARHLSAAGRSPSRTCSRRSACIPSARWTTQPRRTRRRWLPFRRRLRRAVHRQHDGHRLEAIGLALPYSAGAPAPTKSATASAWPAARRLWTCRPAHRAAR
jgi:dihydroxy-acid dehydratase